MARKPKTEKNEVIETPKKLTTSFIVTEKLRGNINNKKFSHEVGDKIELNDFEASVFKAYIKEE